MAATALLKVGVTLVTQMSIEMVPFFENKVSGGTYPLGGIKCAVEEVPNVPASGVSPHYAQNEGDRIVIYDTLQGGNPFTPGTDYNVLCSALVYEPNNAVTGGLVTIESPLTTVSIPPSCTSGVATLSGAVPMPIAPQPIIDHELDLGHTKFIHFSDALSAMEAFPFPRTVSAGTKVNLKCCAGEECTFAFVLYRCEECTGPKPFGMTKQLLLDNWESASCSPKFDDEFGTTLFYKNVQGEFDRTYELHHDELFVVLMKKGAPLPVPLCNKPHGPFLAGGANCGAKCPSL